MTSFNKKTITVPCKQCILENSIMLTESLANAINSTVNIINNNESKPNDSMKRQNRFNPPDAKTAHSEALQNKDTQHDLTHNSSKNSMVTGQKIDASKIHQQKKLQANIG